VGFRDPGALEPDPPPASQQLTSAPELVSCYRLLVGKSGPDNPEREPPTPGRRAEHQALTARFWRRLAVLRHFGRLSVAVRAGGGRTTRSCPSDSRVTYSGSAARYSQARSMKRGLYLAPFGELANPRLLTDLARAAESVGWDGLFLWDRIAYPPRGRAVVDPWVALSAIASVTDTLRLGPMITPLSRRRVQKVARETVTLDHLSNGRLNSASGLATPTILSRSGRSSTHASADACWMRAWNGSADSGAGDSGRSRCRARGFPSGSRQTGPIGGQSDGRSDGTGCSRPISPDRKGSPNSPRRSSKHARGAMVPSTWSWRCRQKLTSTRGSPLERHGCSPASSRNHPSPRSVR
jgi:Luciferase-like monooxygenase